METRLSRIFDDDDIAKIANAYHAWRQDGETMEAEIRKNLIRLGYEIG